MESEILIEKMEFPNKGIGYYNGEKVAVPFALTGQRVLVRLKKKRRAYIGILLKLLEPGPAETDPQCRYFGSCGGCAYRSLPYEEELSIKENMVMDILAAEGIDGFTYEGIVSAPGLEGYRNKMEFSFGDEVKDGPLALGVRKRNSRYEVADAGDCGIIDGDYRRILTETLNFFQKSGEPYYRKISHEGVLRHLVIRKGFFTGEILVNLVTTSGLKTDLEPFAEIIESLSLEGRLTGLLHTVNDSPSDTVKADKLRILRGRDYFMERIHGLDFKISAFSFFQTNSSGAERLYQTVLDFAEEAGVETVWDLYCGTGTIAQLMAKKAGNVVGIELVEEAAEAAAENARLNGLSNCSFIAGDVLKIIDQVSSKPDLIILDPPREGAHPKALDKIIGFGAENIIYVSCKPTSLARDLKEFITRGYEIKRLKCNDMFPRTYHVETVVLLRRLI